MSNARNSVHLIGYYSGLGKNTPPKYTAGEDGGRRSALSAKISVRRNYKDKESNQYQYDYLMIKAFGAKADFLHNYAKDGDIISIDGNIRVGDNYEKDGQIIYGQPEIFVDDVSIVFSNNSDEEEQVKPASKSTTKSSTAAKALFKR